MKTLTRTKKKNKRYGPKIGYNITPKKTIWNANSYCKQAKTKMRIDLLFGFNRYFFRKQRQYVYVIHLGRLEIFFYWQRNPRK